MEGSEQGSELVAGRSSPVAGRTARGSSTLTEHSRQIQFARTPPTSQFALLTSYDVNAATLVFILYLSNDLSYFLYQVPATDQNCRILSSEVLNFITTPRFCTGIHTYMNLYTFHLKETKKRFSNTINKHFKVIQLLQLSSRVYSQNLRLLSQTQTHTGKCSIFLFLRDIKYITQNPT